MEETAAYQSIGLSRWLASWSSAAGSVSEVGKVGVSAATQHLKFEEFSCAAPLATLFFTTAERLGLCG
jgi:hypothetical protein